jgi:hypothetical protein
MSVGQKMSLHILQFLDYVARLEDYFLFTALEQNFGGHKFKDDC